MAAVANKKTSQLFSQSFILATLANFVACCNYFMLMVVMTDYALIDLKVSASIAGLVASIFIIGTLVARLLTPLGIHSFKLKHILFVSSLFEIFLSALYLFEQPVATLLLLRFLHGFSFGALSTTLGTYVTEIIPNARKGEGLGYYMLSSTLGAAIGPFFGILVSRYIGFNVLFIIASSFVALSIPLICFIKPNTSCEQAEAVTDNISVSDFAIVASSNTNKCSIHRSVHCIEKSSVSIGVVCLLIFFAYSAVLTFLTPYAQDVGLTRAASVYFIVYATSMFFTRPISGRIFDRRGPEIVMIPAFLGVCAGMTLLAFSTNDWLLLGSAVLNGYGVGTVQSCGLAMAVKKVPVKDLASANATFYVLIDGGVGAGPIILGALIPAIGYSAMYLSMAMLSVIALAMFFVVKRKY